MFVYNPLVDIKMDRMVKEILQILSVTIFEKTPISQALTETNVIVKTGENDN